MLGTARPIPHRSVDSSHVNDHNLPPSGQLQVSGRNRKGLARSTTERLSDVAEPGAILENAGFVGSFPYEPEHSVRRFGGLKGWMFAVGPLSPTRGRY